MPECSIVIATHQRLGLLRQALDSALAQRDVDAEVVVVENGSTDGTAAYLRALGDPRVRAIISPEPLGATGARNAGLEAATGAWVGFLDDDDLWAPDKLRAQLDAAAATGRGWVYTGCVYIDAQGCLTGGVPPLEPDAVMERLPQRYVVPAGTSGMLWRAGILDDGGLLDPRLYYTVDWDLSLRLSRTGPPAAVPRPLVAFRQHGANMSVGARAYLWELDVIAEKFADLRDGRPLDVAYQHRNAGSESLRAGARGHALTSYYRAVRRGDLGALSRAAAVVLPRRLWPALRRRFLSDPAWLAEAERWLRAAAPAGPASPGRA
jgi:glycosyltransferase involved in cell wall biosynthesis